MGIDNLQTWRSLSLDGTIVEDDFILSCDQYPALYARAWKQAMRYGEPIEQLSPKGLAILLHLFAEKEHSANQPLIVSDMASLKHIATLIDNSEPGIEISLIVQLTDATPQNWVLEPGVAGEVHDLLSSLSTAHKTTLKLVKTTCGINVIHMDGTSDRATIIGSNILIHNALQANATKLEKKPAMMTSYEPIFPENPDPYSRSGFFSRQYDGFQCGVFAVKEARMFAKKEHPAIFLDLTVWHEVKPAPGGFGWLQAKYKIPTEFLKSIQSIPFREYIKDNDSQYNIKKVINPRTGRSLAEIYNKYPGPSDYANAFSGKYLTAVKRYITEKKSVAEICKVVAKFDAGQLTAAGLKAINAARLQQQAPAPKYATPTARL